MGNDLIRIDNPAQMIMSEAIERSYIHLGSILIICGNLFWYFNILNF